MKFNTPLQNKMLVPATGSKCNPEVVFQYDGRLFVHSGSSYISAVDCMSRLNEIWLVDRLSPSQDSGATPTPNSQSEVEYRHCCRHLENRYNTAAVVRFE